MIESRTAHDDVQYLTGSPQRGEILSELCTEALRPTELSEQIDGSRTTVQRVLSGFLDRGWVRKADGRYVATITGRRVEEQYRRLQREVELSAKLEPVAAHMGDVGEELPEAALENLSVTAATAQEPLAAVDGFIEWLKAGSGEDVRVIAPVAADTFDDVTGEILAGGGSVEIVLDETALQEGESPCESETAVSESPDSLKLLVASEPVSTGLAIRDDRVAIGIHDDENNFLALLTSDDPSTYHWARTRYKAVRDRSRPLGDLIESGE